MQSKGVEIPRGLALLWGVSERRGRGPEARYSVHDVANAAIALADRAGLDAVTLASVAGELGLTTTAMYRYVDTKDILIELMVDAAIGDPPDLETGEWRDRARTWALALAERYRAHPWLGKAPTAGAPVRPGVYAWLEVLVAAVGKEPNVDAMRLGLLLDALVRGYATLGAAAEPPPPWLGEAVMSRHPRLANELGRDFTDVDTEFEAAVSIVLRGTVGQD